MMRSTLVLALLLVLCSPAAAKPGYRQTLATHMGPFLPKRVNECRLCHEKADARGQDPARNAFGERLEEVRRAARKAGQPFDLPTRLAAVADEDTDGDGVPNLIEILSGHFPADPADTPTAAEVDAAKEKLPAYRRFLTAHPWEPFDPVKRPTVPTITGVTHPIDAFVAIGYEDKGLTPRPEADKRTLLRRVALDLTGLPPTAEELGAFLKDDSADAYEKAVDRFLAAPAYGERWGRHWMDVWRYSDWSGWTAGNQVRDSQPHVWRWRDWIVESLNADKGYDRMVVEMLAGDEVAPDDPATLRATGYLARNFKSSREKWLTDVVDHTFLAFQAVTVGCARCHDHLFDPIPQRDYYRLRAIFEPHKVRIDRVPGEPDPKKDGLARAYDADPAAPTYLYTRGDDRTPDKSKVIGPDSLSWYGPVFPEPVPVKLPPGAVAPDRREFVIRDELAAAEAAVATARKVVDGVQAVAGIVATRRSVAEADVAVAEAKFESSKATVAADRLEASSPEWETAAKAAAAAQRRLAVAQARRDLLVAKDKAKRDAAEAALKKAEAAPVDTKYTKRPATVYPAESTGRRLALAKWLTDRANPLTARVAVNHVWMRHFGQPLVPTVFDFGKNGRPPAHPALVDWLAAELMDKQWSMKHLHRLIVTSRVYRQSSSNAERGTRNAEPKPDERSSVPRSALRDPRSVDPDNVYLWRFPPHRLEAEVVRDQLLFVGGALDPTLGGPDLDPATGFVVPRRSLYFRHAHERQMEFLKLFDAAAVTECYRREASVVPQQALALANSPLAAATAKRVAGRLPAEKGEFVAAAFERVLGRPPTAGEAKECAAYLGDGAAKRRESLVVVLFNHHEFVTMR
jgi:hypothetical protein